MSDNIDIDGDGIDYDINADSPKAVVSQVGDHYAVIGTDNGETTYASGVPQKEAAYMVAEKVNDLRFEAGCDTHAEYVADDEDILFALTRETQSGVKEALLWGLFTVTFVVAINALHKAYTRTKAALTGENR